jgi:hypothetical protein
VPAPGAWHRPLARQTRPHAHVCAHDTHDTHDTHTRYTQRHACQSCLRPIPASRVRRH